MNDEEYAARQEEYRERYGTGLSGIVNQALLNDCVPGFKDEERSLSENEYKVLLKSLSRRLSKGNVIKNSYREKSGVNSLIIGINSATLFHAFYIQDLFISKILVSLSSIGIGVGLMGLLSGGCPKGYDEYAQEYSRLERQASQEESNQNVWKKK